jgi:hypothetical protein
MPILLGSRIFADDVVQVRDKIEEVGGRDERIIELAGVLSVRSGAADLEAELDRVAAAASDEDYGTPLVLRPNRRLWVRRDAFTRERGLDGRTASFRLKLAARDPCEESTALDSVHSQATASGAQFSIAYDGSAPTPLTIHVTAHGPADYPSLEADGRRITYEGRLEDGAVLVFDGAERRAQLDGSDVTAHTTGLFPSLPPGGAALRYFYESDWHMGDIEASFRKRWH